MNHTQHRLPFALVATEKTEKDYTGQEARYIAGGTRRAEQGDELDLLGHREYCRNRVTADEK